MAEDVGMVIDEEIASNQVSMRQPPKKTAPTVQTSSVDFSHMLKHH